MVYKIIFCDRKQKDKTYTEHIELVDDKAVMEYLRKRKFELHMDVKEVYQAQWNPVKTY